MSDPQPADGVPRANGVPATPGSLDPGPTAEDAHQDAEAPLGTGGVRVVYTNTLPDGVFVVYRGGPPRLLVNEGWWQQARPVERIQALESLWARLQSLPPDAWDTLEQGESGL